MPIECWGKGNRHPDRPDQLDRDGDALCVAEGGVTSRSVLVPISVTAEKIAFNSCALFADLPDGTALEFTFEIGGKVVTKSSEGRHRPVRADCVLQGLDPHGAVQAGEGVISG